MVMAIIGLPTMCRVYLPIGGEEEEVRSQQQSEYYRQWETELIANDFEHSALESDGRGLILDNYSQRSVVAITGDNGLSEKLPDISRTQSKPESYADDQKTPGDESDDACGRQQELAPVPKISHEDVSNGAMSFSNESQQHLADELKRVRTNKSGDERTSRIFSIFSLVRFKNEACTPSGTKNTYMGTCYLATECAERVRGE